MKRFSTLLLISAFVSLSLSCSSGGEELDAASDADTGSDGDLDADVDGDGDADVDGDGDSDSDADVDGDADVDIDEAGAADGDLDADLDDEPDAEADVEVDPCGPALRFSFVEDDPSLPPELAFGRLSPDGTHFVSARSGAPGVLEEYTRSTIDRVAWEELRTMALPQEIFAHLTADNNGLYSCSTSGSFCAYRVRNEIGLFDEVTAMYTVGIWGGGVNEVNTAFTPTPDGARLAFMSNRTSAEDSTPVAGWSRAQGMLWTARIIDPTDAESGFADLEPVEWPPPATPSFSRPAWFADDGNTIIFISNREGFSNVWIVIRPDSDSPWGTPRISPELSHALMHEDAVTLPSHAAICAAGGRAWGYLRRTYVDDGGLVINRFRFEVCLGGPC